MGISTDSNVGRLFVSLLCFDFDVNNSTEICNHFIVNSLIQVDILIVLFCAFDRFRMLNVALLQRAINAMRELKGSICNPHDIYFEAPPIPCDLFVSLFKIEIRVNAFLCKMYTLHALDIHLFTQFNPSMLLIAQLTFELRICTPIVVKTMQFYDLFFLDTNHKSDQFYDK